WRNRICCARSTAWRPSLRYSVVKSRLATRHASPRPLAAGLPPDALQSARWRWRGRRRRSSRRRSGAFPQRAREGDVLALHRDLATLGPARGDERNARGVVGQEHVAGDVTRAAADVVLEPVPLGPARARKS